ncbi:MAG: glycosyltransferase family 9 protein [Deferribacteres bacterium]|nr:glycosyltransferase family 9 protein [candidate division KSB1 bacterium]MCB9504346.1 glycosyltransferase family 9 protein [Deferribacteres bacterium]
MPMKTIKLFKLNLIKLIAKLLLRNSSVPLQSLPLPKFLVYGNMGIGNMVMLTPFLKALRAHYPQAFITLLVGDRGSEAVVEDSNLVDKIIKMNRGIYNRLQKIMQLRNDHYDVLVSSFHGSAFYYVTMLLNIPRRYGHVSGPDWDNKYDFLYNIKVQMAENEHEIDRGLRLAQALGIDFQDKKPMFYLSEDYHPFAEKFLRENQLQESDLLVAVQADTWRAQQWKRWSPQKLARVCDYLAEKWSAKIIIFGAPGHQDELQEFLDFMQHKPIVALGKATLKQSAALLLKCTLAICNDSGLMHISAALGVPTVAIYGPTDFYRTSLRRYGSQHVLVRKEVPCAPCFRMRGEDAVLNCADRICLNTIEIEDVIAACENVIGQTSKNSKVQVIEEKQVKQTRKIGKRLSDVSV